MSVLLHISDTHFGTEQPHVVEALVKLAAQQRPDMGWASGDITSERGRPSFARQRPSSIDWARPCWRFQATTTYRCSICGRAYAVPMHATSLPSVGISNPCTACPS